MSLSDYDAGEHFCEVTGPEPTRAERLLRERLNSLALDRLGQRARDLDALLFEHGVTFTVYRDRDLIDRVLPLDPIPRPISRQSWETIESGTRQRTMALQMFLGDIYGPRNAIRDGIVPVDLVDGNTNFVPAMADVPVRHGTYVHIAGVDLIRDRAGQFMVLEDNCRTPSGVSYVVQNRHFLMREFPDLFHGLPIRSVSSYPERLLAALAETAPEGADDPTVVVLSPGIFNSAYFEHIFLASEMGVPLVEGRDLYVDRNDRVMMRTVRGDRRVDVIYRRIDDAFLDPMHFQPDSVLGVPRLFNAYARGQVTLANAVGTGVADDKALYAYVPALIRYYLSEEPIIPNVPTHICREPEAYKYVLDNIENLVVKPVGSSGGYGICIGPRASKEQIEEARAQLMADPKDFVAQPMIDLSVAPTLINGKLVPRHLDLRPFIVTGKEPWVLPGGLTRVALPEGSLIVNSSQGGGTKDTWVMAADDPEGFF